MSISRRSSLSPSNDLKHRIITCLNRLSDRDTLSIAISELESIVRTLTDRSFATFLSCLHSTDSSEKSPVRKQCVRLLGILSESHGDSLSPYLSKMISTVVRRLRDSDSAIRSACVEAVVLMSSNITQAPFSIFVKSFVDVMLQEQDYNLQIGSALCLAAAIDAAPRPDVAQIAKILPRMLKLVRSECFKAKPALLALLGSIVGAGSAFGRAALDATVLCAVEFLTSEDWAARKAAAEVLGKVSERDLGKDYKKTCVIALESRRFDKVKLVRETMIHALGLWKEVPGNSEEVTPSSPSQSKSSSKDNGSNGCCSNTSGSSPDVVCETPPLKKTDPTSRSPPTVSFVANAKRKNFIKNTNSQSNMSMLHNLESTPAWKAEVPLSASVFSQVTCDNDQGRRELKILDSQDDESKNLRPETKCALFSSRKMPQFDGSGFTNNRDEDHIDSAVVERDLVEEVHGDKKEFEDLSLIHKQLVQIENRQSSLLDLMQRLMGTSQRGMNSLESRVHGLERALDEISSDLALSSGRCSHPHPDPKGNTCCRIPGTEFLSSKFWTKTHDRCSNLPRLSSSASLQAHDTAKCSVPERTCNGRFEHRHAVWSYWDK